jgi:hypothetical protein
MTDVGEGVALKHWTIDKRVPLALIRAMSIQTCGIVRSDLRHCSVGVGADNVRGAVREASAGHGPAGHAPNPC